MMDPVSVTYRLSDIYGAMFHGWPRFLRLLVIVELLWIALIVVMRVLDGWSLLDAIIWMRWTFLSIGGLVLAAFWFGLCPLLGYWRLKRAGIIGPNKLTLVDKGLRVESSKSDSVVYWPAIRRTVRTADRLYLYLVTTGALIVPRRSFDSQPAFDSWADTAQQAWASGRDGAAK